MKTLEVKFEYDPEMVKLLAKQDSIKAVAAVEHLMGLTRAMTEHQGVFGDAARLCACGEPTCAPFALTMVRFYATLIGLATEYEKVLREELERNLGIREAPHELRDNDPGVDQSQDG